MILGLLASWWKEIAIAIVVAISIAFIYRLGYSAGSDGVNADWNAARAEQERAVAGELARRQAEFETRLAVAVAIGDSTVIEVERIREVTRTIVEKVTVYVPTDAPALPAGWGVLHDSAARGVAAPEDAAAAIRSYGAGPSAQDAAETVVTNYGTYHEIAERLRGLQRYVREVCLAPRDN